MSLQSTIAVVIPTFNGSAFIADSIRSVMAQSRPPAELLVVDDCSTDNTLDVVRGVANSCAFPVRILTTRSNSGSPSEPINIGVRETRADVIAVLDQDDIFDPDRLRDGVLPLDRRADVVVTACACGVFSTKRKLVFASRYHAILRQIARLGIPTPEGAITDGRVFLAQLLSKGNFIVGYPGFMFRRRAAEDVGGADSTLRIASDYDLLCKLSCAGSVGVIPKILYHRRNHGSNLSAISATQCASEALLITARYATALRAESFVSTFWKDIERQYFWAVQQLANGGSSVAAIQLAVSAFRDWGVRVENVVAACRILLASLRNANFNKQHTDDYLRLQSTLLQRLRWLHTSRQLRRFVLLSPVSTCVLESGQVEP